MERLVIDLQRDLAVFTIAEADGIFGRQIGSLLPPTMSKIGRLMPKVAETEPIPNRRNSPLNSRAQISDGSVGRLFVVH